ncbi:transcription initiation factor TFIID subunit 8-like [Chenopodium quinoa]|uniref:Transcription initiation factor TFIID subunit 8 n=1 Tax=Chenopodium quinoa TaxID=63459 RepID=A0A803M596_CHEQI|nr:transcription initiation factor TFIID subunit 8-like [Chenopodium quinoa]
MSDGGEKIKRENEDNDSKRDRRAILSIERAEPDDYGRAVSKMAVAQICEGVGFEAIKQSALVAISDIAVRFICDLGKSASFYANLAGRSESNLFDIVKGLQDFSGFSENNIVDQMSGFVRTVEDIEIPFAHPIPRFPVPVTKNSRKLQTPSFLQMGETPSSKHIPDWLPAFPDPHTYIQSPVWSQKKLDLRISKGEQARQRRKAERSLLNLQQRLLSNGLAGPSGSGPPHVNDGERSMGVPIGDNPFLAPPLPPPPPPGKNAYENGVSERKHVLVKETFAPAIDALKGNTDDGGLDTDAMEIDRRVVPNSIPVKRRPVVNFKLKAGKKMLVEDLDIHLRSKVSEKRTSMLGRDDDKDDKKRRAEFILRQSSMDNPQELSQM